MSGADVAGPSGQDLRFGVFLVPDAADPQEVVAIAQRCDALGFDLIGIQDHPYQRRFLDTWTLLSVIGARTERIGLFPDVASLPLRPPAVLAKAAASLDLLTGGRVDLGLGAGAFWEAIEAMGAPRLTSGQALAGVADAIEVLRLMWSDARSVRYEGTIHSLSGVRPGPQPAHPIGLWVGGYGPRILELIGRTADGWVPSLGFVDEDRLVQATARIDAAAAAAGRDPGEIRRVLNINGQVDGDELVELCARLVRTCRIDTFVLDVGDGEAQSLARMRGEVIPRIRERVDVAG